MDFDQIYKQVENLKGWMGRPDCLALHEATRSLKNARIVEIGTFMGISAKVMALSSPTSHVTCIDPYLTVHPSSGLSDPEYVYEQCRKAISGLNCTLIRDLSENVGKTWDKPIDFLHIDGDHRCWPLTKDIFLFVPHVKSGGYVFFHDYVVNGSEDEGGMVKEVVNFFKDQFFDEVKTVSGFAACRRK